ncbi:MAG: P-loop NTPase [Candidatus Altiarchaeota archaeon]|nr:P-loop NTPase [Candidatus Altiarchaeota archaeon]
MGEILGFFSAKGGVGKTTMTANVGSALKHEFNTKVLLVDTHVFGADLSSHFGLLNPPVHVRDFLDGKLPANKVIYNDPRTGIDIIPGPLDPGKTKVNFSKLRQLLDTVRDDYEFILLDTPPWLGRETSGIISSVDEAIVIGTPTISGMLEARRTADMLRKRGTEIRGVLINFYRGFDYELHPEEIEDFLDDMDLMAIIPEDEKIRRALGYGVPAVIASPNSPGSKEIVALAAEVGGFEHFERPTGIVGRLLYAFGFR